MDIRHTQNRHRRMRQVRTRMHNLERRRRRILEHGRERRRLAGLDEDRVLEHQALVIWEQQRLLQQQWGARKNGRAARVRNSIPQMADQVRRVLQCLAGRSQGVVKEDDHRVALRHRVAGRVAFVRLNVLIVLVRILRNVVRADLRPLRQANLLILQRVRQFVRQHRLLLVGLNPVQQVHSLCLVVVETGNLFGQQGDEERLQLEVAVQQPKLLQHCLRARQPFCPFVLFKPLAEILVHLIACHQLAFDGVLYRQLRILAGKLQYFVDGLEQLFRLFFRQRSAWLVLFGVCGWGRCSYRRRRRLLCGYGQNRHRDTQRHCQAVSSQPLRLLIPTPRTRIQCHPHLRATLWPRRYNQQCTQFLP